MVNMTWFPSQRPAHQLQALSSQFISSLVGITPTLLAIVRLYAQLSAWKHQILKCESSYSHYATKNLPPSFPPSVSYYTRRWDVLHQLFSPVASHLPRMILLIFFYDKNSAVAQSVYSKNTIPVCLNTFQGVYQIKIIS